METKIGGLMKKRIGAACVGIFLFASGLSLAAKQPSALSEFAGDYQGTILISSGTQAISGITNGTITASKKKENGKISVSSFVTLGTTSAVWAETYTIQKRAFTYFLNANGTAATGSGRAGVHKKAINFSATVFSGSTTFSLTGTIRRVSKRGVRITQTLSIPGNTIFTTYELRKRGK